MGEMDGVVGLCGFACTAPIPPHKIEAAETRFKAPLAYGSEDFWVHGRFAVSWSSRMAGWPGEL